MVRLLSTIMTTHSLLNLTSIELQDDLCDLGESDNKKRDQLIQYFETTLIGPNAIFPREIWNLHDNIYHRTNNISETYNKKLNMEISKPDPNIYK